MKRTTALGIAAGVALFVASLTAFAGEEPAGQAVFTASKCQACHSVNSASIKVDGADPAEKPEPGETRKPGTFSPAEIAEGAFPLGTSGTLPEGKLPNAAPLAPEERSSA